MSQTLASSAQTTTIPPTDPPDALFSLADVLVGVLTMTQDDEAAALDFAHLEGLKLEALTDASPASHLIATTFFDLLAHAEKRRSQKKRANGGRREPRGSRLDLYQPRLSQEELRGMLTGDACAELFERLEQAVRLAVLAQRSYRRDKAIWKKQHRALALALARVQDVCTRLCSPTGGWFLLVCLKWLLEVLWEKFFGQRVPAGVKARLIYTILEVEYDLACSFLVAEVLKGTRRRCRLRGRWWPACNSCRRWGRCWRESRPERQYREPQRPIWGSLPMCPQPAAGIIVV